MVKPKYSLISYILLLFLVIFDLKYLINLKDKGKILPISLFEERNFYLH